MHVVKTPAGNEGSDLENLREAAKDLMTPFILKLERFDIADGRVEAVIDYAVNFYAKNHRFMKHERMIRKITEYFNLKPKTVTAGSGTD